MTCRMVRLGDGFAIVCARARRPRWRRCGVLDCRRWAKYACDGTTGARSCDMPLCADHAKPIGPDAHLCPAHQEAQRQGELALGDAPCRS